MPARKRILIVDDEVAVGNMLAACCDMWGMEGIVTSSGPEALHVIQSGDAPPDLILTDFMMPGMTGHELIRRARAHRRVKHVPIILASSAPEVAARDSPADVLLPKPFDLDHLEAVLREWLGRKGKREKGKGKREKGKGRR
jgi:two-component system phosphate regulon response regulator PhoB